MFSFIRTALVMLSRHRNKTQTEALTQRKYLTSGYRIHLKCDRNYGGTEVNLGYMVQCHPRSQKEKEKRERGRVTGRKPCLFEAESWV